MILAIYGSRHQDEFLPRISTFLDKLHRLGHTVVMHTKLYQYLLHAIPASLACVTRVTDTTDFTAHYVMSLGGDGTFLRAAAWVAEKEIPVVGVNTGHLGFLASFDIDGLENLADRLATGNVTVESRSLIKVEAPGVQGWPYALNEVTVTKAETASMIHVGATIDGVPLADYRADGLIVATPTGSTAYNLSVGGPIVQPGTPVLVLSPIAAHSLSMRPLVINDASLLNLTARGRSPRFRLSIDGRATQLPIGTTVSLSRAPFDLRAIHTPGHNFADTLRSKLQWG